jgi:hypothetical protein
MRQRKVKKIKTMKKLIILTILWVAGCDYIPEKVEMSDPRIAPMLEAAKIFDRAAYGFTPIPEKADVRLESHPVVPSYDVMLHISSKTSRTISFRKTENGYRWTGEQESFRGPNKYTTVDGTSYEHIFLTFDIEKVSGSPINKLDVHYFGEDPRLSNRQELTLEDVRPILKEWGY